MKEDEKIIYRLGKILLVMTAHWHLSGWEDHFLSLQDVPGPGLRSPCLSSTSTHSIFNQAGAVIIPMLRFRGRGSELWCPVQDHISTECQGQDSTQTCSSSKRTKSIDSGTRFPEFKSWLLLCYLLDFASISLSVKWG